MTAMLEAVGLGKRYGRRWALVGLHAVDPDRARSSVSSGRTAPARRRCCTSPSGCWRRVPAPSPCSGDRPGSGPAALGRVGFLAQDSPTYARLTVAQHLRMGEWLNPGWDATFAREPRRGARARPAPACRHALRRAASPARADARRGQATRAARAGRTGRQPRPAGDARVPPGSDGGRRLARRQRRAVLPSDRRPRAGLRLPRRARHRTRRAHRRGRRPARITPSPHRTPP